MNSTAHMIQDEWLVSYAAGNLTPGRSLLIASHMSYHEPVRAKVADAESIGGALLERATPASLDDALLENLLGRLDDSPAPVRNMPAMNGSPFPPALAQHIGTDAQALKWRLMGPGMHYMRLWDGPGDERVWLLRAKGGITVPEHGHSGDEWTLILKGSYRTELGHYRAGDIDVADQETEHQPVIDDGEDCICLVMTEGPLRMKGMFARMAQPFIGL